MQQLPEHIKKTLLHFPVWTPTLIGITRQGQDQTALALRVEALKPFRQKDLPITIQIAAYKAASGIWVFALAFRVADNPNDPLEGDVYMNPRQEHDAGLLENITKQNQFPVLFFSHDLNEQVGKAISWHPQQQIEVRNMLGTAWVEPKKRLQGNFDDEFEKAKREFQKQFTVKHILNGKL